MPINPDDESRVLRFGPYHSPRVKVGETIQCEMRGLVVVHDWSDRGAIMWPRCKSGKKSALILCGDLVNALQHESALAVAAYWSVSLTRITVWKRCINAPARTDGTAALLSSKARKQMTGKPALPQTKSALLQAAKRPRTREWALQASKWMLSSPNHGPAVAKSNRRRYVSGELAHQCPVCGKFLASLDRHPCLAEATLTDDGELHVPGIASPFLLCRKCLDFKTPDKYVASRKICRKCRSIQSILRTM